MEKYVERDLKVKVSEYIGAKEIIAVVGTRQCGKSTFVNHVLDEQERKGKKVERVSFDNVKILRMFEDDIDSFVDVHVKGSDFLFIDEVQYSKDSGKKLKFIYDSFDIKIFISGSSAAEISIYSLQYLVGRIFVFTLYPFSFREFLRSRDKKMLALYNKGKYGEVVLERLNGFLEEFILYGGYPRVVLSDSVEKKKEVLNGIYSTYLMKEIRDILGLSGNYKLVSLLKGLSLQVGNILNFSELGDLSGFGFSELKKYLSVLEKGYICGLVRPFFGNKRTELVKNPKVYFFDLGFRNTIVDNFSVERSDMGVIWENFIFSELMKAGREVKFWNTKSGGEVDFVLERDGETVPIEIKSLLKSEKLTKAFDSFTKKYKVKKGYFLSYDFEGEKRINDCDVRFLPFLKFVSGLK